MKISQSVALNYKKLKKYKTKSLFLILPIALLVALSVVITSQTKNILTASEKSIFGTIAQQARLIELTKNSTTEQSSGGGFKMMVNFDDSTFSESDLEEIRELANVETADLLTSVPISKITASDLFEDTFSINQLVGLDSSLAAMYTSEDFTYTEGEAIPIILNARTFMRTYEDWNDQTEITITMTRPQDRAEGEGEEVDSVKNSFPVKSEAITYDKTSLLGTEFTISFGGLEDLTTYETTATDTGMTLTKYTDEELAALEATRKSTISTYWDYAKISTPITYTFKVVSVIESDSNNATYIPANFANKLMASYIQNQLDARNDTTLSTDLLNNVFMGLTYDGLELSSSSPMGFGGVRMMRVMGGPGERSVSTTTSSDEDSESYTIPGLVIQTERNENSTNRMFGNSADPIGEYTDTSVYESASRSSETILIKVSDIYSRSGVVEALNDLGFAYQDVSKTDVFEDLKETMSILRVGVTISFIVLSLVVIVFTMGKFVSESRREIGVFRAIGATKFDIKKVFILQALLYSLVGYIIGVVAGLALVFIVAKPISLWFDSFVGETIEEVYNVVNPIDLSVFTSIDVQSFLIFSGLLLLITLVVSLIPASRASAISPVEAIRGE